MVFAIKKYENINLSDCKDWNEWQDLYNADYNYCKTIDYIFEFEGLCKSVDLPSYHPYWSYQTTKDLFKIIDETRGQILSSQKYIDNKGYYSSNAKSYQEYNKNNIKRYLKKINYG